MANVRTVLTDEGEVFTGAVQHRGSSLFEDLFTLVCPPVAFLAIVEDLSGSGNSRATVVVNGEAHTGKVIK